MNKLTNDFYNNPLFTINNLKNLLWDNRNNLENYLKIDNTQDFNRYNYIIQHIETAKILIDAGLNLNYKWGFLSYADSIELMNLLIKAGADLNKALFKRISYRPITEEIKLLLDAGANPNMVILNDRTTLKLLLNKGVNLNMVILDEKTKEKTILEKAFKRSSVEIIKLLLDYGASFELMLSYTSHLILYEKDERKSIYEKLKLELLSNNSNKQEVYVKYEKIN